MKLPTETNKKFYAFISYSSIDEKIVKWLHTRLENYRIPTSVASDSGVSSAGSKRKYLRPIFWYKQDLSGTVLSESLKTNLADSQYLIVICSPSGASSKWVNDEVATFIEQGKEAKIIPVIVAGEPNSGNADTECFPAALRSLSRNRELRGINLVAQGRKRALIDIIATMLGVKFDTLWQRHKRRERRRRIIAAILMALVFAGIWCVYEYKRLRTEYYLDYAEVFGVPEGIDRIDKSKMADAGRSFRFSYSRIPLGEEGALRWRLDKVEYVAANGNVDKDRPDRYVMFFPVQEFRYQDGKLAEIINKDDQERVRLRYTVKDDIEGNAAAIYDITGGEIEESAGYLSASLAVGSSTEKDATKIHSKIKRIHLERDKRGMVEKMTFHSNNDDDLSVSLTSDNNGFYGMSFTRNDVGRVTGITYLDISGGPTEDYRGVATVKYKQEPSRIVVNFFNAAGVPTYGNLGVAEMVVDCNEYYRGVKKSYYDLSGRPMLSEEYVHTATYDYTDEGQEKSVSCFGLNGEPVVSKSGWHRREIEYNHQGKAVRVSYFDVSGEPALEDAIYSVMTFGYNSAGQATEMRYYGTDGAPAYHHKKGNFGERYEYDDHGDVTRIDFLGADGKIADSQKNSYSTICYVYDKYHRCISMYFLNQRGENVRLAGGHAGVNYKYDSRGNEIEKRFFDPDGNLTMQSGGFSVIRRAYDAKGNVVGISYYDDKDAPVFVEGRFGEKASYSERGQQVEKRYVDKEGKLMTGPEWWAVRRREFDDKGRMIREAYFDKDSLPVLDKDSYAASISYTYGSGGNITEIAFFGKSGEPINCKGGYHLVQPRMDEYRRPVSHRYFLADGKPGLFKGLYHRDTVAYDERGKMILNAFFSADGSPAVNGDDVHRYEKEYNMRGLLIEERRYASDGKLMHPRTVYQYAVGRWSWDGKGNAVEYSFYDDKMYPHDYQRDINSVSGSMLRCTFDEHGLLKETAFYKATDTVRPYMYEQHDFDERRKLIRLEYLDKYRKPVDYGSGSKTIISYDKLGRMSRFTEYSASGDFIYSAAFRYNNVGQFVERVSLDEDSVPKIGQTIGMTERYARMEVDYDSHGNNIETRYYDAKGKLMDAGNGYALIRKTYDDKNRAISTATYDTKDKPVSVRALGWHRENTTYNDRNLVERIDYIGPDGQPVNKEMAMSEVSRIEMAYDDYGRKADTKYFRWDGGKYVDSKSERAFGNTLGKKSNATQVMGVVETAGSFQDSGLSGVFYVLQFDSWDIYQSLEEFEKVMKSTSSKQRRIIFLPLVNKDGRVTPGEIVDKVFPPGPLGVRLMDSNYDGISEFLEQAFEGYKEQKK
ncbi:MAG: toll/interleukin-1 receptor domain-containing protein [Muribaculaceae bacterium]|nr:toll/interleukin-1 receptor domain-containing protein [Muribaculaceae bacterium]